MDKIQELHAELGEKEHGNVWPEGHASITEDMMGKFAEWVSREEWNCIDALDEYNKQKVMWRKSRHIYLTTTELIQLFKDQL